MKKLFTLFAFAFLLCRASAADLTAVVVHTEPGKSTGQIDLTVSVGIAPLTFAWTGPSGFTATTEDIGGLEAGSYTVLVTDQYCGTATLTIFVDSTATEIEEPTAVRYSVYPNPATDQITLQTSVSPDFSAEMISISGQIIIPKANPIGEKNVFDIRSIPNGFYYMVLTDEKSITRLPILIIH